MTLIIYVKSKNRLCILRTTEGLIDLNGAYFEEDQRIRATRDLDLIFNICDNTEKLCNGKGYPSTLSQWDTPEKCYSGGKADASNDFRIYLIDPNDAKKGVILRYYHGDIFEQEGQLKEANTQITIKCNMSTENTKPLREDPVVEGNIMLHRINFQSRYACPGVVPQPRDELCVLKTSQGNIDLRKAAYPTDQIIIGPGVSDFMLNICKNVTLQTCNGKNNFTPLLWYHFSNLTQCYASGRIDKIQDTELKLLDENNPSAGVSLRYKNGDTFDHGVYGIKEGNSLIKILCDPNSETIKPLVDGVDVVGNIVTYKFKTSSKHACPVKK